MPPDASSPTRPTKTPPPPATCQSSCARSSRTTSGNEDMDCCASGTCHRRRLGSGSHEAGRGLPAPRRLPCHLSSCAGQALADGPGALASKLLRLAASLWLSQYHERYLLEERLCQALPPSALVCYINSGAYDETPMRLSMKERLGRLPLGPQAASSSAAAPATLQATGRAEVTIVKVLQTQSTFAYILSSAISFQGHRASGSSSFGSEQFCHPLCGALPDSSEGNLHRSRGLQHSSRSTPCRASRTEVVEDAALLRCTLLGVGADQDI